MDLFEMWRTAFRNPSKTRLVQTYVYEENDTPEEFEIPNVGDNLIAIMLEGSINIVENDTANSSQVAGSIMLDMFLDDLQIKDQQNKNIHSYTNAKLVELVAKNFLDEDLVYSTDYVVSQNTNEDKAINVIIPLSIAADKKVKLFMETGSISKVFETGDMSLGTARNFTITAIYSRVPVPEFSLLSQTISLPAGNYFITEKIPERVLAAEFFVNFSSDTNLDDVSIIAPDGDTLIQSQGAELLKMYKYRIDATVNTGDLVIKHKPIRWSKNGSYMLEAIAADPVDMAVLVDPLPSPSVPPEKIETPTPGPPVRPPPIVPPAAPGVPRPRPTLQDLAEAMAFR